MGPHRVFSFWNANQAHVTRVKFGKKKRGTEVVIGGLQQLQIKDNY